MPVNVITLRNVGLVVVATYDGPHRDEVVKALGTDAVPTPFAATDSMERRRDLATFIARKNPQADAVVWGD